MANNPLLDVLAPCYCLLCGCLSQRLLPLCEPCEAELPHNSSACTQCALPLPASAAGQRCGQCQVQPPAFTATCAPWVYTDPVAGFIQQFKFKADMHLLPLLRQLLAPSVLQQLHQYGAPDALVPVPLHWSKKLLRGFNQSAVLAQGLRRHPLLKRWGLSVCEQACVKRIRTPAQHGLSLSKRRRNLRNAFDCKRDLTGQYLVIIDDVMTTGTTANCLAQALLKAGARRVDLWCFARTPGPDSSCIP